MAVMTKAKFEEMVNAVYAIFTAVRTSVTGLNTALDTLLTGYSFFNDGVLPTNDADILVPCVTPATNLDSKLGEGILQKSMLTNIVQLRAFIQALESHFQRMRSELVDYSIDGYIAYVGITDNAMLVKIDDIWNTLKNYRLQARSVPASVQVTMYTADFVFVDLQWTDTDGDKLFVTSGYSPNGPSNFENYAAAQIEVTKSTPSTESYTFTITGIGPTGSTISEVFTDVEFIGTIPKLLDITKKFVDIADVSFTTVPTADVSFTFKNVLVA